jgi:chromosome segregation ATPase
MATNQDLQDLIENIRKVGKASRKERSKLFDEFEIPKIEWELEDPQAIINYISRVADEAGLSPDEKNEVIENLANLLDEINSVEELEFKLITIRDELNLDILDNIIAEISDYKPKIENATTELEEAIDRLNNLSKVFGTIAIAVNLFTALISASSGSFGSLIKIVAELL